MKKETKTTNAIYNGKWSEGTISIPDAKDKTKYTVCRYWVKHYEGGSEWGINGGKISKLEIRIDDLNVCSYDRGWDIKPTCTEAELALSILLNDYN